MTMNASIVSRMLSMCAVVLLCALTAAPARAELLDKSKQVGHVTVQYKVVLPTGYDAAKAYPGILVFGGGPQTMTTVDGTLTRNFRTEAEKRRPEPAVLRVGHGVPRLHVAAHGCEAPGDLEDVRLHVRRRKR